MHSDCDRMFFSFAVWWNLWVRCETELGVTPISESRNLVMRVFLPVADRFRSEFVVPVFLVVMKCGV